MHFPEISGPRIHIPHMEIENKGDSFTSKWQNIKFETSKTDSEWLINKKMQQDNCERLSWNKVSRHHIRWNTHMVQGIMHTG